MENFVHTQGTMATNNQQFQEMRMGMVIDQQNLVDVPIHFHDKPRLRWTRELHDAFLDAVHKLGGPFEATPKKIQAAMNLDGITYWNVKSHLQKFRKGIESGRLVRRRFRQDAPYAHIDVSDGSGSSNSAMASISYMESESFEVPIYSENNEVPFEVEPQLPSNEEEDISSLPPITLSGIDEYLDHFDQSGGLEMENVRPSSEPVQGSYEEVVQALPPITSSRDDDYLNAFRQSGDWAMENLFAMDINKPWGF